MNNTTYDTNHTRYQLATSSPGTPYNWLFFPGGPGLNADYLQSLVVNLELPGKTWLIDLPANGDNFSKDIKPEYDFNKWNTIFIDTIKRFKNPILVGHSFAGMYPLLFPELEQILQGFIILNSLPSLGLIETDQMAKERNLPSLEEDMARMHNNPCPETAMVALIACVPYYFHQDRLKVGTAMLKKMKFNYHAANWWLAKISKQNFIAQWIPHKVKTLIIGGTDDSMMPFTVFENDARFKRDNIHMHLIKEAGHFPWVEKFDEMKEQFHWFIARL